MNAIRLMVLGCLVAALGLTQLACSKKDETSSATTAPAPAAGGTTPPKEDPPSDKTPTKEAILGKWHYKDRRGAEDMEITLEFTADKVTGKWNIDRGNWKSDEPTQLSISGSYAIIDDKTLEMPKFGEKSEEKITIDSITKDKLVLRDIGFRPGFFQFSRPGAGPGAVNKEKIVGAWEASKTNEFPFDLLLEFSKDGKLKMTVKAASPIVKDSTYKIDEYKITVTRKEGGKEQTDTWIINVLTDENLVYTNGRGTITKLKRKT